MPASSDDSSSRRPANQPEELQPAIDAAAGEPRTGAEPGAAAGTDRQRAGAADDAADEHPAPVGQPSQDNTDRRV